ncbi:uncharacterized protein LOC134760146 [Pongo abelii]|uniref:uncharacterized protein LOC134760146 n=1 Tax=Pongo abelii TaxID=9601 RepID=UPI0030068DC2
MPRTSKVCSFEETEADLTPLPFSPDVTLRMDTSICLKIMEFWRWKGPQRFSGSLCSGCGMISRPLQLPGHPPLATLNASLKTWYPELNGGLRSASPSRSRPEAPGLTPKSNAAQSRPAACPLWLPGQRPRSGRIKRCHHPTTLLLLHPQTAVGSCS